MDKFKNLSEKKREPYLKKYQEEVAAHKKNVIEFFNNHKELKKGKNTVSKKPEKIAKIRAKLMKPSFLSPFTLYRQELSKEGKIYAFPLAQKMYKELPDEEKFKYVTAVLSLDCEEGQEKRVSKEEMKILDSVNGLPKRPLQPYNIFVQNLKKNYDGENKDFLRYASDCWKDLSQEKKDKLQEQSNQYLAEWRVKMEAYIRTLPKEQQHVMFAKHKIYQKNRRTKEELEQSKILKEKKSSEKLTKPKSSDDDISSDEDAAPSKKKKVNERKETNVTERKKITESIPALSPKKTRKDSLLSSGSDGSNFLLTQGKSTKAIKSIKELSPKKNGTSSQKSTSLDSPKKRKLISESSQEDDKSMIKKVKKISESSQEAPRSPKKKKIKAPEYPSQTTAHYFMSKVYDGSSGKVAKAYKKLGASQKKEMREKKKDSLVIFLTQARVYVASLDEDGKLAFKQKVKEEKEKQADEISWHINTGTDDENSEDDSSDDSDSS